ncbi:hypothetical protein HanPI659440_Chr13g0495201 [Helianthus annuus]|nr:hypothetical protein HanPI659440_Chr13g0495201 [Helianthus annuus]
MEPSSIPSDVSTHHSQVPELRLQSLEFSTRAVLLSHFLFQFIPSHAVRGFITQRLNLQIPPCQCFIDKQSSSESDLLIRGTLAHADSGLSLLCPTHKCYRSSSAIVVQWFAVEELLEGAACN